MHSPEDNRRTKLSIAVIGATKFGKYHVREYRNAGCDVRAILGSSQQSARATAEMLKQQYDVQPTPYANLHALLRSEQIDAVSICTPPELHEEQVRTCIEHGVHVLCEKPFMPGCATAPKAMHLLDLAREKKCVLTVNTQNCSLLDNTKIEPVHHIEIYVEPGERGANMLQDHLPHTNSLLVRLIPQGIAQNISFATISDDEIKIEFGYRNERQNSKVTYLLHYNPSRPRAFRFTINDSRYSRLLTPEYKHQLVTPSGIKDIRDPLQVSVERFVSAVQGKGTPLVNESEVLDNCKLQDVIIEKCNLSQA